MVKKILLVSILLPLLLLVFAPKKELFYLLQRRLAQQGITVSGGTIHENPLGLSIEHPSVYFKGIKVADIQSITLWSLLVYSRGSIDGITFDPSLRSFLPAGVQRVSAVHSLLKPTHIRLSLRDPKQQGDGDIDISKRILRFVFTKLPSDTPLKEYLKSNKGGWDYEQRF
jgi:hypothetical protein